MSRSTFYTRQLEELVGGEIIGVIVDAPEPFADAEEFFGLQIKVGKKLLNLWIMQDDEGNGPGSFSLEEQVASD